MHNVGLWLMFMLGQVISMLIRADMAVVNTFTPWSSIKHYFLDHQSNVIQTAFVSLCLFLIWWTSPALLDNYGLHTSTLFPLNMGTAGIYGFLSDKIVDYLLTRVKMLMAASTGQGQGQ